MTPSLYMISSVIILDQEGNSILSQYYPLTGVSHAVNCVSDAHRSSLYERSLFDKTKSDLYAQVQLLEDHVVLFRPSSDLIFYMTCPLDANELLVQGVLDCLVDVCNETMMKGRTTGMIDKSTLLDNYDILSLLMDELIDNGYIYGAYFE